ncbi:MAG: hypothetical protein Q8K48_06365, partial [Candidatus Planktophila sp.]|nr:hypothetical protein [Candidatus Planktophila sp.]
VGGGLVGGGLVGGGLVGGGLVGGGLVGGGLVGGGLVGGGLVGGGLRITTPLFQTNFLPDLMHVNFLPAYFALWPLFLQIEPALTAANANCGGATKEKIKSDAESFSALFTFAY